MNKYSTKRDRVQVLNEENEEERRVSLPGGEVVINARAELLQTAIQSGLQVMQAMLEEDVKMLCGPRYRHQPDRKASRWGETTGEVTLGGRRVAVKRPRVRSSEEEETLPTYKVFSREDLLRQRVLEQILVGVSTRRYERSLETSGKGMKSRGTSKSAVSRRFVARTAVELAEWMSHPLDTIDLVVLFLDGIEMGGHTLIVAMGVDIEGKKSILGVWEGSTENAVVCQMLLSNLVERGLQTNRDLLVVIDGSKALRKAVRDTFGERALIQRCQQHKRKNVVKHLPKGLQTSVEMTMRQAYQSNNVETSRRILTNLACRLDEECPGAAASLREGMDETLTVIALGLPETLRRSLQTTNVIESVFSIVRNVSRNVKRWRNGKMALRWTATGLMEAEKRLNRVRGYRSLPALVSTLQIWRQKSELFDKRKEVA